MTTHADTTPDTLACSGCAWRGHSLADAEQHLSEWGVGHFVIVTNAVPPRRLPRTVAAVAHDARAKLTKGELNALRAELRRELAAETRPARTPRVRETPELAGAARRMVRAVGQRASADLDQLPLLVALQGAVDAELRAAVRAVRDPELTNGTPWSWADVGRVLGITRQAAQQRFGGQL